MTQGVIQRVQPGTNRPLGKRKKKIMKLDCPRRSRMPTSINQKVESGASAFWRILVKPAPLKRTSIKAQKSAMRSADLRQKISAPSAKHTSTEIASSVT